MGAKRIASSCRKAGLITLPAIKGNDGGNGDRYPFLFGPLDTFFLAGLGFDNLPPVGVVGAGIDFISEDVVDDDVAPASEWPDFEVETTCITWRGDALKPPLNICYRYSLIEPSERSSLNPDSCSLKR
jgi:hypothetical protein